KVRVLVESQGEMAEGIGRVPGLLQRTQHQIRENALLGLAGNFVHEPLIMLRRDVQLFAAWKGDSHRTLTPVTVGIGPASFCWGRHAAVAHRDFALMEIYDTERVAKGARQLLEFEHLACVRLLVHAMQ